MAESAPSEFVRRVAHRCVAALGEGPAIKVDLADTVDASVETVQRALSWLRSECGAPLSFDADTALWTLCSGWTMPTHEQRRAQIQSALDQAHEDMQRLDAGTMTAAEVWARLRSGCDP